MHSPLQDWLTLFHLPGLSPALFHALVDIYGGASAALAADPRRLEEAGVAQLFCVALRGLQKGRDRGPREQAERAMRWAEYPGHHLLRSDAEDYPPLLKSIADPPPLLFLHGDPALLPHSQVAMVGSRNPTAGGRRAARRFAAELAGQGLAICSGMARGIDRESHLGALEAGGLTIGVVGTGIDLDYPRANRDLADRVRGQGALLSELPLGSRPARWNFPRRNRIISGLSLGVLVVEAARRSGSLITASCALEQGREVFALPGSIDSAQSCGCHYLIQQGARLAQGPRDILEELGWAGEAGQGRDVVRSPRPRPGSVEAIVAEEIGFDAVSMDGLLEATGLDPARLGAALVQLELEGAIESVPGGYSLRRR